MTTTVRTANKYGDFDKRKSRDDLALLKMSTERHNFMGFHKPNRGRPSLDAQQGEVPRKSMSDSRPGKASVGMALGSPIGHAWSNMVTTTIKADVPENSDELKRRPSRKWGLFSRSKSKRGRSNTATDEKQPMPQQLEILSPTGSGIQSVGMSQATVLNRSKSTGLASSKGNFDRSEAVAMKATRHVPRVVRSNTDPVVSPRLDGGLAPRPSREGPRPSMDCMRAPRSIAQAIQQQPERNALPQTQKEVFAPETTLPTKAANGSYQPQEIQLPTQGSKVKLRKPPPISGQMAAMSLSRPHGPMLDIEIPDITMERYSLMFGHLLPTQQAVHKSTMTSSPLSPKAALSAQPPPVPEKPQYSQHPLNPPYPQKLSQPSSSSLLARRQAALTQLKAVRGDSPPNLHTKTSTCRFKKDGQLSDNNQAPRPRREISQDNDLMPPPSKRDLSPPKSSPIFCLFPATPRASIFHTQALNREGSQSLSSAEGMSVISSANSSVSTPVNSTPEPPQGSQPTPKTMAPPKSLEEQAQPKRLLTSRFQRQPSGNQIPISAVTSPIGTIDILSPKMKAALYATPKEPSWEMMPPPMPKCPQDNVGSRSHSRKASLSSITDVEPTEHISVLAKHITKEDEEEQALRAAVEASIHRQISVSREQREMLKPFQKSIRRKKKDAKSLGSEAVKHGTLEGSRGLPPLVRSGDA